MASLDEILLLGDSRLYEVCEPVTKDDIDQLPEWINELSETLMQAKQSYGFGRGIAAPQLGIMKRLVYIYIDAPMILLNPEIVHRSKDLFTLWDDCLSFPSLLVKVSRNKSIMVSYEDEHFQQNKLVAEDGLSELLQHEIDHLEGILCTMRAVDDRSFRFVKK